MLRNIVAVVIGFVVGGLVNGGLVEISSSVVPLPPGVDPTDPASLKAGIHLLTAKHFVMPFLAHALGTFAGALVAYLVASTHKRRFAMIIGVLFLVGGIASAFMIPAPAWFIAVDLLLAYLPMAWLAARIGSGMQKAP